jgi:cellulose synthase/poly-beta-1,6-N-acetylglucosamine synthase-like glycosyltransferase
MAIMLYLSITIIILVLYSQYLWPAILKFIVSKLDKTSNTYNDSKQEQLTIIVPAYKERERLIDKILDLHQQTYPHDKITLHILIDGNEDSSYELLLKFLIANEEKLTFNDIIIDSFEHNQGKAKIINIAREKLLTPYALLTDVSAMMQPSSIANAMRQITSSTTTGLVAFHYKLLKNHDLSGADSYWQQQNSLKVLESKLGILQGVHGAGYMVRSDLIPKLSHDTINDDFIIPAQVISRGYRVEYCDGAMCYESEKNNLPQEIRRRRRIAAGNIQQIFQKACYPKLLARLAFWSHKGLRGILPLLIVVLAIWCIFMQPILTSLIIIIIQLIALPYKLLACREMVNGALLYIINQACRTLGLSATGTKFW